MVDDVFAFSIRIKKRTLAIVLSVTLILALLVLGGVMFLKNNEDGSVIIRGKVISDISIEWDPPQQTMLVPFVEILRELGYDISQQDEDLVIIADNNKNFELNLAQLSLYEVGGIEVNYLESPPGFYYAWCCRKGNDIELDIVTFASALSLMDSNYTMVDVPKLKTIILYKKFFKN